MRPADKIPALDYSRFDVSAFNHFYGLAITQVKAEPGSYVTLSRIFGDRTERQVSRTSSVIGQLNGWLDRCCIGIEDPERWTRFRLRLWGKGGRPEGGIHFVIGYPETEAVREAPPKTTIEEQVAGLGRELAVLRRRLTRPSLVDSEETVDLAVWCAQVELVLLKLSQQIDTLGKNQRILNRRF